MLILVSLVSALLSGGDPLIGHWTAALDRSKFAPGFPGLRHQSLHCTQHGHAVKCVALRVPIKGRRSQMRFTARYDGREYPVTGSPDVDTVVLRRTARTVHGTFLKAHRAVFAYRIVPSADGRQLTITSIDPRTEQNLDSTVVYERR